MRFVHCSDIHQLQPFWPHQLLNKRITGALNLLLFRRWKYRGALFGKLLERIVDPELAVERLVITGDLSNLSLDREFAAVAQRLAALPMPVTVIPGNHDAYVKTAFRRQRFEHYFAPFMEGDREGGFPYPFVQTHDGVAFVGVSSAVPTAPFSATGYCSQKQLNRLDRAMGAAGKAGLFRVLLIHHPLTAEQSHPGHDLTDADALQRILFREGAELVLHGHEHRLQEYTLPWRDPKKKEVTIHGISSAISLSRQPDRRAAFAIYDVAKGKLTRELWCWNGQDFARDEAAAE